MDLKYVWAPKPNVYGWAIFADTVHELASVAGMHPHMEGKEALRGIRMMARQRAITLRKMLREGMIDKHVARAGFHKVREAVPRPPFVHEKVGTIEFSYEHGGHAFATSYLNHRMEVHDIPGMIPTGNGVWELDSMIFDIETKPILSRTEWMRQKIIEIYKEDENKRRKYSLGDLIWYVANTEGAHAETIRGKGKRKDLDWLEILGSQETIIYQHWIVICATCYIYNQMKEGFLWRESEWKKEMGRHWIPPLSFEGVGGSKGLIALPVTMPMVSLTSDKKRQRLLRIQRPNKQTSLDTEMADQSLMGPPIGGICYAVTAAAEDFRT